MKHKVTVYLTDEELAELRKEAKRRRLSLSRYMTERLDSAPDHPGGEGPFTLHFLSGRLLIRRFRRDHLGGVPDSQVLVMTDLS